GTRVLQRFASLCFRGMEMVATDKEIREAGSNGD
ncbi:hypothetical protein A2U01_0060370, partial [Trifolium medium]|nr:hypothetical protein [Trifolium medium]